MLPVQAPAVDPLDALASILPSADPAAPSRPVYTGPEVVEVQCRLSLHARTVEMPVNYTELLDLVCVKHDACVMCHSMASRLRRVRNVEKEMTRCHQATDLKIWSVCPQLCFPASCLHHCMCHLTNN